MVKPKLEYSYSIPAAFEKEMPSLINFNNSASVSANCLSPHGLSSGKPAL